MSGKVKLSSKARVTHAADLFEEFTGHEAESVEEIDFPDHDTIMAIGSLDAVMYTTVRDGEVEKYIHEFRESSRPLLCVSHDGLQLYIVGGQYKFKDSGINDT